MALIRKRREPVFSDEDEKDYNRHRFSMERIADELHLPFAVVEKIYGIVLSRYVREARVTEFLPLLVGKRVKDLLRKRAYLSSLQEKGEQGKG